MIVDCALYERGVRRPGLLDVSEALRSFGDRESFVWLGLYEPSPEEFDEVRRHFDLHELAVEDAAQVPTSDPSSRSTTSRCSWS